MKLASPQSQLFNSLPENIRVKLSLSTRSAFLSNNFDFLKDNTGKIGAFVKTSKDISNKLRDLGVDTGMNIASGLFTARFPQEQLIPLASIPEVEFIDIGERVSHKEMPIGETHNIAKPTNKVNPTNTSSITKNQQKQASIFTPKNILIGATAVLVVFGILKWQKVI